MTEPPAPSPALHPAPKRSSFIGLVLLFDFFLLLMAGAIFAVSLLVPGPAVEKKIIIIPRQSGLEAIGVTLMEHKQVYHPWQFALPAKLMGADDLKPGEYEFPPRLSVLDIIALLRSGKSIIHKLTIPEGLTNAEVVRLLEAEPRLQGTVAVPPEEGTLYPATYNFTYGDSRTGLLEQMTKLARQTLEELWAKRPATLPLATPQQALTLASMIEKETGVSQERARIAGVFYNRLRLGMRLQSDPTVIYALTQGKTPLKRALSKADLAFASPYNTYVAPALPPAPIANPGRAALQAALQPETHDWLYFVADGSGGHAFAKTLDEHNRYVSRWRKLQEKP